MNNLAKLAEMLGLPEIKEGQDVHRLTAMQIYGVAYDAVTPEQRRKAKALSYHKMFQSLERRQR